MAAGCVGLVLICGICVLAVVVIPALLRNAPVASAVPTPSGPPTRTRVIQPTFTPAPEATEIPPTEEATAVPTPVPALTGTVNALVNIREHPDRNSTRLGQLQEGEQIQLTGRNEAGDWYYFEKGWVIGTAIDVDGDPATLPVLDPNTNAPAQENNLSVPDYRAAIAPINASYLATFNGLAKYAKEPDAIYTNPEVGAELKQALQPLYNNLDKLKALAPPASLRAAHQLFLQAAQHYVDGADLLKQSIDRGDRAEAPKAIAAFQQASKEIQQANQMIK